MKYKLIIFDLDGTLLDTIDDLGTAVNYALGSADLPLHPIKDFRAMVGNGVSTLVRKAMPLELRDDDSLHSKLLEEFMSDYSEHIHIYTRPYKGIPELLEDLQEAGIQLAVASNKFQSGTEELIRHFFPDIKFCAVLGNSPKLPLKPDQRVIEEVMIASGRNIAQEEIALVGDSGTDMQTAINAQITGIAVTWGFKPEKARAIATHTVNDITELRALLGLRFQPEGQPSGWKSS